MKLLRPGYIEDWLRTKNLFIVIDTIYHNFTKRVVDLSRFPLCEAFVQDIEQSYEQEQSPTNQQAD